VFVKSHALGSSWLGAMSAKNGIMVIV
jgi:hypothetical protein